MHNFFLPRRGTSKRSRYPPASFLRAMFGNKTYVHEFIKAQDDIVKIFTPALHSEGKITVLAKTASARSRALSPPRHALWEPRKVAGSSVGLANSHR